jgi:hypothetical protein
MRMLRMEEKEEKGSHVVWGGLLPKFTTTDAVVVVEKKRKNLSFPVFIRTPSRERETEYIDRSLLPSFFFLFLCFLTGCDF